LEQPLVAGGWVIARRGQIVTGQVVTAQKAHGKDDSRLGVELVELTMVDGQVLPVTTQLVQTTGPTYRRADGAIIGTTTGVGAVVGAIAGGGEGAAIGATAGAAAGIVGVLSTHGRPTILPAETLLSFRLEAPLAISTERSGVAFQPVGQRDYGDQDAYGPLPQGAVAGEGPAPYYSPYAYPTYYAGYYPYYPYYPYYYPYFGYYGLGFYGGFRGGFVGGFRGGFAGGRGGFGGGRR
jgi:hypothetical protein